MTSLSVSISIFVLFLNLLAVLFDAELNKESKRLYSRYFRWRRVLNWLPMGIAYAAFYMARYNVATGNIKLVQEKYKLSSEDIGLILSGGSWSYALTAPISGRIVDRIGGRNGILIACLGSSLCNGILGCLLLKNSSFIISKYVFLFFYALNICFQGFGTSAGKINSFWYTTHERGLFSGVFNILLTSGYYLALGLGPEILHFFGFAYLFLIPSILLFVIIFILYYSLSNSPSLHSLRSSYIPSTTFSTSSTVTSSSSSVTSSTSSLVTILKNRVFLGYLIGMFCISFLRDGFMNFLFPFLNSLRNEPLDRNKTAILGASWTLGGFLGGFLLGYISDKIYESKRVPPILLFSFLQLFFLCFFYSCSSNDSILLNAFFVFLISISILGTNTLLGFTVPQDLPSDSIATSTGLLTFVGYIGSGVSTMFSSKLIQRYGYSIWIISLVIMTILSMLSISIGSYFSKKQKLKVHQLQEETIKKNKKELSTTQIDKICEKVLKTDVAL